MTIFTRSKKLLYVFVWKDKKVFSYNITALNEDRNHTSIAHLNA